MRENGVFFTPVKYTLVCRAPWVSWAAQHTTVCLDIIVHDENHALMHIHVYHYMDTSEFLVHLYTYVALTCMQ